MSYVIKISEEGKNDHYRNQEGKWVPFRHRAQTFDDKKEAKRLIRSIQVFLPTGVTIEVVEA